ncbi:hypothetical protein Ciccas_009655 [Cichlidogyrus casuarinus]|uniref:Uncharacterized protein n=1 Tax=Cichlidogyrus casuarinus TaxID=1844966 RepID=A0ABD2PWE2_9PLAT
MLQALHDEDFHRLTPKLKQLQGHANVLNDLLDPSSLTRNRVNSECEAVRDAYHDLGNRINFALGEVAIDYGQLKMERISQGTGRLLVAIAELEMQYNALLDTGPPVDLHAAKERDNNYHTLHEMLKIHLGSVDELNELLQGRPNEQLDVVVARFKVLNSRLEESMQSNAIALETAESFHEKTLLPMEKWIVAANQKITEFESQPVDVLSPEQIAERASIINELVEESHRFVSNGDTVQSESEQVMFLNDRAIVMKTLREVGNLHKMLKLYAKLDAKAIEPRASEADLKELACAFMEESAQLNDLEANSTQILIGAYDIAQDAQALVQMKVSPLALLHPHRTIPNSNLHILVLCFTSIILLQFLPQR